MALGQTLPFLQPLPAGGILALGRGRQEAADTSNLAVCSLQWDQTHFFTQRCFFLCKTQSFAPWSFLLKNRWVCQLFAYSSGMQ